MTKPSLSALRKITIFTALFCLCACDAGTGVNGGGLPGGYSDDAKDGGSWLTGAWKGNYKNKEAEEGSALRETGAVANFKETEARTGDFTISLPALDKVVVKGIYHDFQGKSLLLDIKQSNLSTIGSPNSSTELSYDLVGDALELHNDRITIRLVRGESTTGGGSDDGDDKDPNKDAIIDDWLCKDGNGLNWKITIDDSSFALDVFDAKGARKSIWMKGDMKITRGQTDADVVLTVTSAENKKYVGLELRGNNIGPNLMNLRRMSDEGDGKKTVAEIMQCNTI